MHKKQLVPKQLRLGSAAAAVPDAAVATATVATTATAVVAATAAATAIAVVAATAARPWPAAAEGQEGVAAAAAPPVSGGPGLLLLLLLCRYVHVYACMRMWTNKCACVILHEPPLCV